jgi:hypothetical protein
MLVLSHEGRGKPTPTAAELREQMRQLQTEREAREPLEGLIELKTLMTNENLQAADGRAAIELRREMAAYNMVWIFEPVDMTDEIEPVVVPLCHNGRQWVTLEPGSWRLSLVFGRPGRLDSLPLPAHKIRVVRDRVYSIEIGAEAEKALQEIERQSAREADFRTQERDENDRARQLDKP